jgi:hypothetical protein
MSWMLFGFKGLPGSHQKNKKPPEGGRIIYMKSLSFYRTTEVSELVIATGLPALTTWAAVWL